MEKHLATWIAKFLYLLLSPSPGCPFPTPGPHLVHLALYSCPPGHQLTCPGVQGANPDPVMEPGNPLVPSWLTPGVDAGRWEQSPLTLPSLLHAVFLHGVPYSCNFYFLTPVWLLALSLQHHKPTMCSHAPESHGHLSVPPCAWTRPPLLIGCKAVRHHLVANGFPRLLGSPGCMDQPTDLTVPLGAKPP